MRELTLDLEENHLDPSQFVLWGGYVDHPRFEEHKVNILDTTCGHVPAPWIRSHLVGPSPAQLSREWIVSDKEVAHRSGLSFPSVHSSEIDGSMFHPDNAEFSVIKLHEFSNKLMGISHRAVELPLITWTPLRKSA